VRFQPPDASFVEPLGGQQEVHAHGPPQATDGHEGVDELRLGRQQLAELVHDHQQVRQVGQVDGEAGRGLGGVVVADRVEVPGIAEQLLASVEFLPERGLHAVHQGQLVGQVGDQPYAVGQVREVGEGRTALEVDQHEVHQPRVVPGGQPGDQGAQQLALARAGGPDEDPVRPHPAGGKVLEVEHQR